MPKQFFWNIGAAIVGLLIIYTALQFNVSLTTLDIIILVSITFVATSIFAGLYLKYKTNFKKYKIGILPLLLIFYTCYKPDNALSSINILITIVATVCATTLLVGLYLKYKKMI